MAQRLELIRHWLSQYQAISFKHSVREGNQLADFLANIGVDLGLDNYSGSTLSIATQEQLNEFKNLVEKDQPHRQVVYPDAGALRTRAQHS